MSAADTQVSLLEALDAWMDAKLEHHWATHHTGFARTHTLAAVNEARKTLEREIKKTYELGRKNS